MIRNDGTTFTLAFLGEIKIWVGGYPELREREKENDRGLGTTRHASFHSRVHRRRRFRSHQSNPYQEQRENRKSTCCFLKRFYTLFRGERERHRV